VCVPRICSGSVTERAQRGGRLYASSVNKVGEWEEHLKVKAFKELVRRAEVQMVGSLAAGRCGIVVCSVYFIWIFLAAHS